MVNFGNRTLGLTLAVILIAACSPAPTSIPPLPTSTASPTFTVTPISMKPPPTPTALPATPTSAPPTLTPTVAPPTEIALERSESMNLKITVKDTVMTATLVDSKTSRDFISLLPLTVTLEDYGGTEKISYLPKKLSTQGAPAGIDPSVGDITYYAPWGNLAIFYQDFGYSNGLVLLGKIEGDMAALSISGPIPVTIELVK